MNSKYISPLASQVNMFSKLTTADILSTLFIKQPLVPAQALTPLTNSIIKQYANPTINPFKQPVNTTHLLAGLRNQELSYHLQPINHLDSGKTIGFEALIRWTTGNGDTYPPMSFLPLLLRRPLAAIFQRYSFKLLIEVLKKMLIHYPDCYLAYNAPPRFFHCKRSVSELLRELQKQPVNMKQLIIEIPEQQVLLESDNALENISKIRHAGIRFALDDFGKLYSNFDRLRTLPVDIVKIDRCFITNICNNSRDRAILKAIIEMGKALNFTVIAEGAEQQHQIDTLKDLGVSLCQGYYFSRPKPHSYWF